MDTGCEAVLKLFHTGSVVDVLREETELNTMFCELHPDSLQH